MAKAKAKDVSIDNLLVRVNAVSTQAKTRSASLKWDRANCDYEEAIAVLCGARLDVELRLCASAEPDTEGQGQLIDTDIAISSVADVGAVKVQPDSISATVQFSREDTEDSRIDHLAYRAARFTASRIGDSGGGDED